MLGADLPFCVIGLTLVGAAHVRSTAHTRASHASLIDRHQAIREEPFEMRVSSASCMRESAAAPEWCGAALRHGPKPHAQMRDPAMKKNRLGNRQWGAK
jgi:hypothetical protein